MARAIAHRGPDADGCWIDENAGLALGHRRLSILDLSPAGAQPMRSADDRWILCYNGEVYNHLNLRRCLEAEARAPNWRGHSDTETLLAAISAWGVEITLRRSVGMFAFALWDRNTRCLTLARDRLGEKPLYYGWQGKALLFGSELKALACHPSFTRDLDRGAVALLMQHNYIPAPHTIWRGVAKLLPGTFITFTAEQRAPEPRPYWSLAQCAEAGQRAPLAGDAQQAEEQLEEVLRAAVGKQMLSDVPLGALLSGGLDSSLVVALMQAQSNRPVRTFCIGFEDRRYDESPQARAVAKHLGTDHTELIMTASDVLNAVPRVASIYDEPFADSSQLPTMLVMNLARRHVTVALSGDGGDELFGGYNRYLLAPKLWGLAKRFPGPVRRVLGSALTGVPAERWNGMLAPFARFIKLAQIGEKLHKAGQRLGHAHSIDDVYRSLVTEWRPEDQLVLNAPAHPTLLDRPGDWPDLTDPVARMMALDALTYMPDDILVKVDRAAMCESLETRAPYLDPDVVELAWRLPMSLKIRGGTTKWLLRQILYRHVPAQLVDRPKMGFGIPLDTWLRGPLRTWADDLLSNDRLKREGILSPAPVQAAWQSHRDGRRNLGYRLWSILMLNAWLQENSGFPQA